MKGSTLHLNQFQHYLMIKILSIVTLLLASTFAVTQNRASVWHFGQNVELTFCSGSPVASTGPISTGEGCASINDMSCNWQFSTDGINVVVANPPGSGTPSNVNNDLLGDPSSTSSAIIVPKPCEEGLYYIFTVDYVDGSDGIRFSVFDQSLNAGIGGIRPTEKNIFLAGPSAERITAVKHANGKDYWIISIMQNTNEFHRWLVTCQGISNAGTIQTGPVITRSYGYIKASHCCDQLAMAFRSDVLLYSFDNQTGFINHQNTLTLSTNNTMYGVEYTFDCSYLIATELGGNNGPSANIYQISNPCSSPSLTQTWNVVNSNGGYTLGAIQIGPDNNLYIAKDREPWLAMIDPTGTTLTQNAIALQTGTISRLGLPTLISGNIGEPCNNVTRLPTSPTNLKLAPLGIRGVEYADMTSDGLYDVIATLGDDIVYYENIGPGLGSPVFDFNLPNILHTASPVSGYGLVSFTLYDQNGSGVPDLFIIKERPIGYKQIDYIPISNGPTIGTPIVAYPANTTNGLPNGGPQFMKIANLDPDAEPELILSDGSGSGSLIVLLDGIAGSPFAFSSPITLLTVCVPGFNSSFPIPELFDVDCDGDLDLFLGVSTEVLYYENTGNSTSLTLQDCNTLGSPCQLTTPCAYQSNDFGITNIGDDTEYIFPRFIEVNNDGKPDLYVTRWVTGSPPNHSQTTYYESENCCACPYELCLNYSPIPSGIYEANYQIKSNGTIPVGNNVTFKANNKQYNPGFTVNGILTDVAPGCSSCCGVTNPLSDLAWLAPYVGDSNYSIAQCSWNGECIFKITDFCLVSDGTTSYFDCEGILICETYQVGGSCSGSFNPTDCHLLQGC